MQLTASVLPVDPAPAVPTQPGLPPAHPDNGTARDPVPFASLLPGQARNAPAQTPVKKSTDTSTSGTEAAAAVWSTWFASLTPTPAPQVGLPLSGINVANETGSSLLTTDGTQGGAATQLGKGIFPGISPELPGAKKKAAPMSPSLRSRIRSTHCRRIRN